MRKKRIELIEKEIITYTCDICGHSTENNKGCCGSYPIMVCGVCMNDICRSCRECYMENPDDDYCDIIVCDSCNKIFKHAWNWALDNAARNDIIKELALDRYVKIKDMELKGKEKRKQRKGKL